MKALLLLMLLGIAAVPSHAGESTRSAAAERAVSLANADAKNQFGVAPFTAGRGIWREVNGRWQWEALAGYGAGDLIARVSFTNAGAAEVSVSQIVLNSW